MKAISVITPTADRPAAFALAERWMERQTLQPDEWIVADGGATPARCTMGQRHIHHPLPPGPTNLAHNVLRAAEAVEGDIVVIMEDDDWYAPTHIETMAALLNAHLDAWLGGYSELHYYNPRLRKWRSMLNSGASLSQTALRHSALPLLQRVATECLATRSYAIDRELWIAAGRAHWTLTKTRTCIGIKGLPGPAGLGKSGYPNGAWRDDPHLHKLREWIGDDAMVYAEFYESKERA